MLMFLGRKAGKLVELYWNINWYIAPDPSLITNPRTTKPMAAMMRSVRSLTRVTRVLRWEVTWVE